jgi:hypothetical protein
MAPSELGSEGGLSSSSQAEIRSREMGKMRMLPPFVCRE